MEFSGVDYLYRMGSHPHHRRRTWTSEWVQEAQNRWSDPHLAATTLYGGSRAQTEHGNFGFVRRTGTGWDCGEHCCWQVKGRGDEKRGTTEKGLVEADERKSSCIAATSQILGPNLSLFWYKFVHKNVWLQSVLLHPHPHLLRYWVGLWWPFKRVPSNKEIRVWVSRVNSTLET